MRAETVAEIVDDVIADFTELEVIPKLTKLLEALQAQTNDPSSQNQVTVKDYKEELLDKFRTSRFINYPVSLRLTLDEMNLEEFLPERLAKDVELAFSGNEITPASVLADVQLVLEKAKRLFENAEKLAEAAIFFEFEAHPREGDEEFDFTVSIPRDAVNNELDDFGRELIKIDKLLGVFSEIATGSREDFQIKSISSSELTVVLESAPAVAVLIVTALERLTTIYERMLNIIILHRKLKETNVPETMIRDMEKFTQKTLAQEVQAAAKEIEGNLLKKMEAGRRQEIRTELKRALEDLISRFDRGYVFDVRGPDPVAADSEGENAPDQQKDSAAWNRRVVAEKRDQLRYFKADDEPLLGLSAPLDEDGPQESSDTSKDL